MCWWTSFFFFMSLSVEIHSFLIVFTWYSHALCEQSNMNRKLDSIRLCTKTHTFFTPTKHTQHFADTQLCVWHFFFHLLLFPVQCENYAFDLYEICHQDFWMFSSLDYLRYINKQLIKTRTSLMSVITWTIIFSMCVRPGKLIVWHRPFPPLQERATHSIC